VSGTLTQAKKSFQKKPILVWICIRITRRHTYNSYFLLWRGDTLTKGILAVALMESTTFLIGKADKKLKGVSAKDWGKLIRFGPNSILMIP
jgi:hypothetical protein